MWNVTYEHLEPASLSGRIWFVGFVRVAGQAPFLDALYYGASEVGRSESVFEVLRKLAER
jgi:hypothetical protein